MLRERLGLLLSLGWPGYLGIILAASSMVAAVVIGIYIIAADDDRLSGWLTLSALITLFTAMALSQAVERKGR
jgi:hypothetical protein